MKFNYNNQVFEFKPISIGDREAFRQMPDDVSFVSCEYSFANLFMWGKSYDMQWCSFYDAPLVLIGREDVLFFPLCSGMNSEKLKTLSQAFIDAGGSGNITQVPEQFIKANPELNDLFEICEDRNFADYLHRTERLKSLTGRKLSKKRNFISQFIRNNPDFQDLQLIPEEFDGCLELAQKNIDNDNQEHREELAALKRGFAKFADLKLDGRLVKVENKTVAFSVFSMHIDESYLVHFEKSDYDFKGAAQIINQKTAEYLKDKCKYINREQDLGIPGLKKAKMSYDPDIILTNYNLTAPTL